MLTITFVVPPFACMREGNYSQAVSQDILDIFILSFLLNRTIQEGILILMSYQNVYRQLFLEEYGWRC